VGLPTVKAIVGNKFIPGLLDRYLAWIGYGAQQTDEPIDSNRPHNLFAPLPGDYGAHGRFDEGAREASLQFWMNRRRAWLGAGLAGVAAYVAYRMYGRQDDHSRDHRSVSVSDQGIRMREETDG